MTRCELFTLFMWSVGLIGGGQGGPGGTNGGSIKSIACGYEQWRRRGVALMRKRALTCCSYCSSAKFLWDGREQEDGKRPIIITIIILLRLGLIYVHC
ncbi:hypothetical protein F4820DRAFT_409572 [Hypoxylon rubiginosum]|uniref:Uncharacterized protein n=1 Tax=Hypoxylon rubiginosum TaxID=110542 RepID=A0ACB9Z9L2_9PEZI|nr:hypothetical protein F4820DRAFT_409572 [Hypoxylon rubiginosum]